MSSGSCPLSTLYGHSGWAAEGSVQFLGGSGVNTVSFASFTPHREHLSRFCNCQKS